MSVQAFSLLGIIEAQTAQFEARVAAAGKAIDRLSNDQTIANRAAGQLRIGLQGVAMQAIGTSGPVGQLSAGLLGLFGGAAGLALVAAVGAVAFAIRQIGSEAEDSAKRIKTLADERDKLLQAKGPNVGIQGRRQELLEQRAGLEAQLDTARKMHGTVDRFGEARDMTETINRLQNELNMLAVNINLVTDNLREAHRKLEEDPLAQSLIAGSRGIRIGPLNVGGIPSMDTARPSQSGGISRMTPQEMIDALTGGPEGRLKQEQEERTARMERMLDVGSRLNREWEQMDRAMELTRLRAQLLQVALINAVSGAIASLVSGGGIGGFLMGAGGIIGFLNPVAGAIVSGFGTIVSSAESKRNRHTETQTDRLLDGMRENRPIIIHEDNLTQSAARWNRHIARGGKGPVPSSRAASGLRRP